MPRMKARMGNHLKGRENVFVKFDELALALLSRSASKD